MSKPMSLPPLQPDTSFHIFNHANGFDNVFNKEDNFRYFLEKYQLYISPIAETYAYCLMPNHFHLVVRIRKRRVIEELILNKNKENFSKVSNFRKVSDSEIEVSDSEIEKYLSKQFSNLFSCYTQSYNKMYHRMGSLFIKNFKRDPIRNKKHFLNLVIYIHRNPIHHGFRKNYNQWEFSSYNEIVDGVCDHIEIAKLFKMTDGLESFEEIHRLALDHFNERYELEIP